MYRYCAHSPTTTNLTAKTISTGPDFALAAVGRVARATTSSSTLRVRTTCFCPKSKPPRGGCDYVTTGVILLLTPAASAGFVVFSANGGLGTIDAPDVGR